MTECGRVVHLQIYLFTFGPSVMLYYKLRCIHIINIFILLLNEIAINFGPFDKELDHFPVNLNIKHNEQHFVPCCEAARLR